MDSYVIISPCRDEAAFCRRTLESVARQTHPPALWVIVDDGSTDGTGDILREYAQRLPWLRIVRRADRGGRSVGQGVIDAFYEGWRAIAPEDFDFMCKLDLDLDLPERYFEVMVSRMRADPHLGTCSGKPYYLHPKTGRLVSEGIGDDVSVGAAKFYRMRCFEAIGGFVPMVMWDGIDCHRCRMLGWRACSWDDPAIRFIHLRPMGSSVGGLWDGRVRHGRGQHFMGTSLPYMTASALYRMTRPPLGVGGLAMWWGYVRSMIRREPRYGDPAFRRFLRSYQWSALLRGKAAAIRRLEARRPARDPAEPQSELQRCAGAHGEL